MTERLISKEQVQRIAQLCKLSLTEVELEKFSLMFSQTLAVIDVLNELDTDGILETYQVNGLSNVFQKGAKSTVTREEALQNADEVIRSLFVTKGVFDR
ncbi:MAG TPA: aspartyl/glutamyl-tRNA amidotransferase subunit C [Patescibacteria group bacterium]|nr:aspartyl/glutamyl-tRNA amidotransferase subunit C [Patescibacteria group bacterium]